MPHPPSNTPPSPRRYLVTGGAGFIGSHTVEALLAQGHHVTVLDDLSTGSSDNLASVTAHPQFTFQRGSVLDTRAVARAADGATDVIHLAAAVGVFLIFERPVELIESNLRGTENVLAAARRNHSRVLLASTSEVYGKSPQIPFRETDDVVLGSTQKSRWSYAASKMMDEFMGLAYHQQYGVPVTLVRLFNTIGPRQVGNYGMVVPRFVRQALRDQPLTIYGDGSQARCFCDVSDVVRALLTLAAAPDSAGNVFNIGSTEEITIAELANRVVARTGSRSHITFTPYEKAYAAGFEDITRRVPDTSALRALTGWQPAHSLDDSLDRIVAHERAAIAEPLLASASRS